MDPELDRRLTQLEKKIDENTSIVKKLRRNQKRAVFMKLLYWAIVIGLGILAISYIKPYVTQLGSMYGIGEGSDTDSKYGELIKMINE